ncbi:hypothetical protein FOMPIDRAFT_1025123 [Fomitopsis schrenkii]|uniref:Uncharacterized protein n=1 Tax=Fomitopsis schrenkii TaxID=2126942 RepID=S8F6E3_FOMSC|nr:hypothetical protein FOMPIDRAFT_1025123 [Fomitopsis schrenkii]
MDPMVSPLSRSTAGGLATTASPSSPLASRTRGSQASPHCTTIGLLDSCPDRHTHRCRPHHRCVRSRILLLLPPAGQHTHFFRSLRADVSPPERTI